MKKIIIKITNLLATKKSKIVAVTLAVVIITGGVFVTFNIASAQDGWAVLLNFFGKANVTGDIYQSVLLDGGRYWSDKDTRTQERPMESILSGETRVSSHTLENRSLVDQGVKLSTTYYPGEIAGGITTKYYRGIEGTITEGHNTNVPANKYDLDTVFGNVEFSVDYNSDEAVYTLEVPGFISASGDNFDLTFDTDVNGIPDFQISYRGESQSWVYQEVQNSIWVTLGVPDDISKNKDGETFTVGVSLDRFEGFGSAYRFGIQGRWNGDTPDNLENNLVFQYPSNFSWGTGYMQSANYYQTTLGTEIPSQGGIYTIKAGEKVDFVMESKTDGNMVGGNCIATVVVSPAE